jgi:hypothetical protein
MNDYETSAPRAVSALVAVAMTTITMGALVVLPAKFDSIGADASVLAAAKVVPETPREIVASPAQVEAPAEEREAFAHAGHATIGLQALGRSPHPSRTRARASF